MKSGYGIVLIVLMATGCHAQKSGRVIFYNTENLYDTIDDPHTADEEFTPTPPMFWDSQRYHLKLDHIARVLSSMGEDNPPLVIGLCEIEHRQVTEDLIAQPALIKYHFGIIERESPDMRGIEVALLYNRDLCSVSDSGWITVVLPDSVKPTREILWAKLNVKGESMYVFVNHWPSRREGTTLSNPRRAAAATAVRAKVDELIARDPDARILIAGDLNDNPTDSSISYTLGALAGTSSNPTHHALYDMMTKPYEAHEYSLKYKGEHYIFDQIIVSGVLLDPYATLRLKSKAGVIFKEDWMLYHSKNGDSPNRTYSGPKYHGGYSDHLPVYIDLQWGR